MDKLVALIETYKAHLKKYALSLTHNKEDADDLYQDTIYKILSRTEMYEEQTYFKSWASTIMRNLFVDKYRKKKKYNEVGLGEFEMLFFKEGRVDQAAFNNGEGKILIENIMESIANLKENHKQIITLRLQGYSFIDISTMLGIGAPALRSIHFKAIRILRKNLKDKLSL
jgi:RNA polymerase sigma-70 factor (ECF subfamily)